MVWGIGNKLRAARHLLTGSPPWLVCYEKFERIETSQFLDCFNMMFYRESIEIVLIFGCHREYGLGAVGRCICYVFGLYRACVG